MKAISYAVTVSNEHEELKRLLDQLLVYKRNEDEIVVQVDQDNHTTQVMNILKVYAESLTVLMFPLNGDFATFKNNIKNNCKKDYIVFLDADEYVSETMLTHLSYVLDNNEIDVFLVPRHNKVIGITEEHIAKWGWRIDDQDRINWPDYQMRVVVNKDHVFWTRKVHEVITGAKTISHFPMDNQEWCLYHIKTIEKQESQNKFYSNI